MLAQRQRQTLKAAEILESERMKFLEENGRLKQQELAVWVDPDRYSVNTYTDRQIDGWIDRQIDRQIDSFRNRKLKDGYIHKYFDTQKYRYMYRQKTNRKQVNR